MAEEKRRKDEQVLALSHIPVDELKAGRRWGALACLAHLNGPQGVFMKVIRAWVAGLLDRLLA